MRRFFTAGFVLLMGMCAGAFADAADAPSYPDTIAVHGHHYRLQLQQNHNLSQQLSAPLSARHYHGKLVGHPQSWVRISNVDGSWQGILSFGGQVYLIDLPANSDSGQGVARSLVMSAQPVSSHPPVACGHPGHVHGSGEQSGSVTLNSTAHSALKVPQQVQFSSLCQTTISDGAGGQVCLLAEMEFAFDQQFQNLFGANARAQAESLINMAEGFYRNDFNIIFHTLTLELIQGALFSTTTKASRDENGDGLLEDIRNRKRNGQLPFIKNTQALFHLVTGRDFDGSTAGVAYVNAQCNASGYGVGASQVLRSSNGRPNLSSTSLVVAHELGHNFGASHDGEGGSSSCTAGGFIMAPFVSSSVTEFSSCSKNTIRSSISALNTPERCFNFPADLAITSASGNPTSAVSGAQVALEYTVTTTDAYRNLAQIAVSGSVPASRGRFNSAELNGQSCTVAADGLSYRCTLDNPPASTTLLTRVAATSDGVQFTQRVAVSGDNEIVDINSGNNQQQTALAVTAPAAPPAAASGLSASQGSGTRVDLSWTDNSNDEDNFRLERRVGNGTFSTLATLAANVTRYTDTTSVGGTSYGYRVIALNGAGDSAASNTVTIAPTGSTPAPAPNPVPAPAPAPSSGGGGSFGGLLMLLAFLLWFRRSHAGARA